MDGASEFRIFWTIAMPLAGAGPGDARHPHVPGVVELVHLPARDGPGTRDVHAAGGAGHVRDRPVPGRPRDAHGRRPGPHPARPDRLRAAPALDHRRASRRRASRADRPPPATVAGETRRYRHAPAPPPLPPSRSLGALVIAAAALPASPWRQSDAAATRPSSATLLRYAARHLGLVRGDDRRGHGPARRQPAGRRHAQRPDLTTNIGAYLWSTVVAEALGLIDHGEAVARVQQTLATLDDDGAPRGRAASSTTGTTTRTGAKLTVWPLERATR